jgi:hypothetical protein
MTGIGRESTERCCRRYAKRRQGWQRHQESLAGGVGDWGGRGSGREQTREVALF